MKILIVDDELVSRMTLQKLLESIAECTAVESGEDALKVALSDNPPDLILLDILMPGIDGFEVCAQLKAAALTKDVPVIFLSANTEVEDKTRGIEMGAVDYITKPFHKAEVKARVRTHLALKKMREDLQEKNITLERQVTEIREKTEQLREKDLQLIEMDRLAGIGTLAAGIAHEINNPAMFILSNVGILEQNWPAIREILESTRSRAPDEEIDLMLEEIPMISAGVKNGIDRIRKIVNSLRDFAKHETKAAGMLDINKAIAGVIEFLKPPPEHKSPDIITELQDLPPFKCAMSDINQCLLQVIKNAYDALGEGGGTIRVVTSCDAARRQITIRVIDNGRGMSPDVLRQAFNPFFTTRAVGSGTGVGLSLTERIIKRYGGTIQLESAEGLGTTATITLPAGEGAG